MATDAFIAISLANIIIYLILVYKQRVLLWRLVGESSIILMAGAYIFVADSIPMFIIFSAWALIAGIKLMEDAPRIFR